MTVLAALVVFALDRLVKIVVMNNMTCGQSIEVLPKIFHITLIFNTGTAFGLFQRANLLLVFLSIAAITVILIYIAAHKYLRPGLAIALGLLLGGALGNLFDRIKFGNVIDFLDFRIWPVFNIADSALTIGMIILGWHTLVQGSKRKTQN
ncbi:MAG: signal peptidase II [Candidatus Omnitrophota bacterium]